MTTITLAYRASQKKIRLINLAYIPWKAIFWISLFCLMLLSIEYILVVNQLIKGSYLIKTYIKEADALSQSNGNLEKRFAESGFLGASADNAKAMGFENTASVTYVRLWDGSLVEAQHNFK